MSTTKRSAASWEKCSLAATTPLNRSPTSPAVKQPASSWPAMMLCNYNVLILDEPNNHLDLEAVSALSWALQNFEGTVLFASHDRSLLSETAKKIVAFEEGKIEILNGTLEEYLAT